MINAPFRCLHRRHRCRRRARWDRGHPAPRRHATVEVDDDFFNSVDPSRSRKTRRSTSNWVGDERSRRLQGDRPWLEFFASGAQNGTGVLLLTQVQEAGEVRDRLQPPRRGDADGPEGEEEAELGARHRLFRGLALGLRSFAQLLEADHTATGSPAPFVDLLAEDPDAHRGVIADARDLLNQL